MYYLFLNSRKICLDSANGTSVKNHSLVVPMKQLKTINNGVMKQKAFHPLRYPIPVFHMDSIYRQGNKFKHGISELILICSDVGGAGV